MTTEIEFEPTRSFAYRFARYVILPELQQLPEAQSGKFILRELAWPLIDKRLSPEQQAVLVKKAQSDAVEPMGRIIRFYVPFLTRELGLFIKLGEGEWRAKTEEELKNDISEIEDEDEVVGDNFAGTIYAFSYPSIIKDGSAVFPIKVGKTTGDVNSRVADQCKGSAAFEQPKVLATWQVKRVGPTELAIHNILKAR